MEDREHDSEVKPEDVQGAIKMFLFLFKDTPKPNFDILHRGALKRAQKVLGVTNERLNGDWRERLQYTFGLNPDDPMHVIDPKMWDLAWQQFRHDWRFSDALHAQLQEGAGLKQ